MNEMTMGRRERKKAATRKALADAALDLFLERGYDQVSVKDIADAADVSTTTLFKHFPSKEALVFDEDAEQEAALVSAVRDRAPGRSIPAALCEGILHIRSGANLEDPRIAAFRALVEGTPVLRSYAHRMWMRHQAAVAHAIAEEIGAPDDDAACAALARFALEAPRVGEGYPDPRERIRRAFDLLERGWSAEHGRG
ncbi:TetR family transcriptional regulator [Streptomyces avermitilis]|uniref:TetR-family transcriptional regulator n=4 Tax=Streptomyces TaxID=1883 RepID=Q82KV0_STRAW|nr:TetR family transcriptional regulator [Streptomyces avermitilis]OOV24271.1 TetR family transcriptional regulator [Streptomyces avermitilis]BAC69974.1 putative TetR-family transcriptional regulator [Streptomyces avermitilis MA-4680 = NBRC 14893]GDY77837.1 TetR family transcriptional regulator [Streptomyces avermitilis]GDY86716.1 TetR family transcriptional regulator [Streptomyces avermitilis]